MVVIDAAEISASHARGGILLRLIAEIDVFDRD